MSGTNYLLNPAAQTNLTSWSATNATLAQDSAQSAPGAGTYCVAATASSTAIVTVKQSASGLTVGRRYTAAVFCKVPAAVARSVYGTAATASGRGTLWSSNGLTDEWTRIRVTFTASSATQEVDWVSDGTVPNGEKIYFSRMSIVEGEAAGPYFDGSYPGCAWTGTAHASTSTCAAFTSFPPTTEEAVTVGGLCLNTQAWNIVTRSGRVSVPALRGSATSVPAQSGRSFVANRPYEPGLWGLGIWILGSNPDGTVPKDEGAMRRLFEKNLARLQQAIAKSWQAVTLTAWQADGTARTALAQVSSQIDGATMMGGRRAEYPVVFEILAGWWKDAVTATITGAAGSGWSNQALSLPALAGGTAPIEDAVVTVTGPATNPRITTDSGVWVQCNATVAAGTTWVFNCTTWASTRNGVSNMSEISHSGHARYLSIPAAELLGIPKVTMTCSGSTGATNLAVAAARSHWGA